MLSSDLIFVHIPRTGGRSVLDAIGKPFAENQHTSIREHCEKLTEEVVRSRFVFATVRNPWERAVSWYLFFGLMGDPYMLRPFAEWIVTKDFSKPEPGLPTFPLNQLSFCRSASGEILVQQFLRYEALAEDFVPIAALLRVSPELKNLGSDEKLENAKMREALYKQFRLPRIDLVSIAKDYRAAYTTQAAIDAVARIEADLIDRFGYQFGK